MASYAVCEAGAQHAEERGTRDEGQCSNRVQTMWACVRWEPLGRSENVDMCKPM